MACQQEYICWGLTFQVSNPIEMLMIVGNRAIHTRPLVSAQNWFNTFHSIALYPTLCLESMRHDTCKGKVRYEICHNAHIPALLYNATHLSMFHLDSLSSSPFTTSFIHFIWSTSASTQVITVLCHLCLCYKALFAPLCQEVWRVNEYLPSAYIRMLQLPSRWGCDCICGLQFLNEDILIHLHSQNGCCSVCQLDFDYLIASHDPWW